MNISIDTSHIDLTPAMKKIQSRDFWLFSAHEWQRILYDYIPHDTNQLRNNVTYKPGEIIYNSPYANYIYNGMKMVDNNGAGGYTNDGINWFSIPGVKKKETNETLNLKNGSRLWDKKAISEKKDLLLVQSMQNWIEKNL